MVLVQLLWAGASWFTGREVVRLADKPLEESSPEIQDDEVEAPEPVVVVGLPESPPRAIENHPLELAQILGFSTATLVLSAAGAVGPSLFRNLSTVALAVGGLPLVRRALRGYERQGHLDYAGLLAVQGVTVAALGFPGVAALSWMSYAGGQGLRLATDNRIEHPLGEQLLELSDEAWLYYEGAEVEVALAELEPRAQVLVRAGELVPADGRVLAGAIRVSQRSLLNESHARELSVGDEVLGATRVLRGAALVEVTRVGAASLAGRVRALIDESDPQRARAQSDTEFDAELSVPFTVGLGGLALVGAGPLGLLGGMRCNFVDVAYLGSPLLGLNAVSSAAKAQMQITDLDGLEQLAKVDVVVLDMASVVEREALEVREVRTFDPADQAWRAPAILEFAAALEADAGRDDALTSALIEALARVDGRTLELERRGDGEGLGLGAVIDGQHTLFGTTRLLTEAGIELPEDAKREEAQARARGQLVLYLGVGGRYRGRIELAPRLHESTTAAVEQLRARGLELLMVSGRESLTTQLRARDLGISTSLGSASAADKLALVVALQESGRSVCFVGGEPSDALALRQSQVAVSLGTASDQAMSSVQISLLSGHLDQLVSLFELADLFSRRGRRIAGRTTVESVLASASLLAGGGLPPLVALYMLSMGLTLITSLAPLVPPPRDELRQLGPAGSSTQPE